jgi:hypothetical protein
MAGATADGGAWLASDGGQFSLLVDAIATP